MKVLAKRRNGAFGSDSPPKVASQPTNEASSGGRSRNQP
jgi:hypothetical protein